MIERYEFFIPKITMPWSLHNGADNVISAKYNAIN